MLCVDKKNHIFLNVLIFFNLTYDINSTFTILINKMLKNNRKPEMELFYQFSVNVK